MKEGDNNTKNFHLKTSAIRRKNRINGLKDEDGRLIEEAKDVEHMFYKYFINIFTTINISLYQMSIVLLELSTKVRGEMENYMDRPFIKEKIIDALA